MKILKTKFNYLILIGRIFFTSFFLLLSFLAFYTAYLELNGNGFSVMILFAFIFLLILIYLIYHFADLIINQSYNIFICKTSISKVSIFNSRKRSFDFNQIKGFSTSDYPIKIWTFKSIIVYLNSGEKIEIPQFLYFNFKAIEEVLINNAVKNFGYEEFKWKSFNLRYYKFE
jgi:hypothetical protein